MDRLGGRKFMGFIIILAIGVAVHVTSKAGLTLDLITLLLGAYGAFALGNVSNTILAMRGGAQTHPGAPQPAAMELGELAAAVTELRGMIVEIHNGVGLQNQAIGMVIQNTSPNKPVTTGPTQAEVNRAAAGRVRGFLVPEGDE